MPKPEPAAEDEPVSGAGSAAAAAATPEPVTIVAPTLEELESIPLACQRLWELDEHRLTPGTRRC